MYVIDLEVLLLAKSLWAKDNEKNRYYLLLHFCDILYHFQFCVLDYACTLISHENKQGWISKLGVNILGKFQIHNFNSGTHNHSENNQYQ